MAITYTFRTEVISGNNFIWCCADDSENQMYYEHAAVCANGVVDEAASEQLLSDLITEINQESQES
jgi:hypothetical protein